MSGRARPERLRDGSKVALVAPAGPVDKASLDRGVAILRGWGLQVEIGDHVLDRHPRLGYLAGRDEDRAADLQRAWCDPTIDAVLCARGGYGAMRIVDALDWTAMAEARPKVFTGSSDITALHVAIGDRLQVATLFAPMIATESFDRTAQEQLRATLFDPESMLTLRSPAATTVTPGISSGILAGGNLSLLTAGLAASRAPPPPDNALVLLEDVDEPAYRIDRMITQLRRADWFAGVTGIVLGSWTRCGGSQEVYATVTDLLGDLDVPVVWDVGFGHCAGQLTIPLGVPATLDADRCTIALRQPALS
jgi:muramoyltetrapeptide carboxypeptidase